MSPSGVAAFLSGLDMEKFSKISAEPVPIPLRFETIEQCVNFWGKRVRPPFQSIVSCRSFSVTLDLLNFGSGYRHQLHELQGRGAYESMVRSPSPSASHGLRHSSCAVNGRAVLVHHRVRAGCGLFLFSDTGCCAGELGPHRRLRGGNHACCV